MTIAVAVEVVMDVVVAMEMMMMIQQQQPQPPPYRNQYPLRPLIAHQMIAQKNVMKVQYFQIFVIMHHINGTMNLYH